MNLNLKNITFILLLFVILTIPLEEIQLAQNFSLSKFIFIFLLLFSIIDKTILKLKNNYYIKLLITYAIYAFATSIWSGYKIEVISSAVGTLFPLIIFTLLLNVTIATPKRIIIAISFFLLGSLIAGLGTIHDFIKFGSINNDEELRVAGFGMNPNAVGLYMNISFVFILIIYSKTSNLLKHILLTSIPFFGFIIFLGASRTSFIILLLISTIVILINAKKRLFRLSLIAIIIIPILISFVNKYIPQKNINRLFEVGEKVSEGQFTNREIIWSNGIQLIDYCDIIFGKGFSSFKLYYNAKYGSGRTPHNTYLEILFGTGMIGFLIFVLIFAKHIRHILFSNSEIKYYSMLLIAILLVSMFTSTLLEKKIFYFMIIIIYKLQLLEFQNSNLMLKNE